MIYDYIIVGAGIAGLYAAYNLKKYNSNCTFLILEANDKKYIGGRIHEEKFANHLVTTGAGIGRKKKDKYLINLLDELKVKYTEFDMKINYAFDPIDIKSIINDLQTKFSDHKKPRITFKQFALPILGSVKYKKFITSVGYTDYENADVEEALYTYGFEDNIRGWKGLSIPWTEFIDKLIKNIGMQNIKTNTKIESFVNINNIISVNASNDSIFKCNKLIVATTITSLRKLFKNPIYKEIEAQPFLRVYATISKQYIPIMKEKIKNMTIVNNELQKIYPIDPDNGLYAIAYCDNKNAIKLRDHVDNKEYMCNLIKKALNIKELKINKIINFYRDVGTHYYKPLNKIYNNRNEFIRIAQNPSKNIFVIGEVVSENQGWTNSALSTYHKINKFLKI
jgi:hypothetical protein